MAQSAGMQERELQSVLRLLALALDKHPNIFCGGQRRPAVAALLQRLLPILCQRRRSGCGARQPQL